MTETDRERSIARTGAYRPRPRVLVLMSRVPWPLDDGGRIEFFQNLLSLSRSFDVTLVTLALLKHVADPVPPEIAGLGIRVVRVAHRPPAVPVAIVRGLIGRWPYTLVRYRNPDFDREIRGLVRDGSPDFAFFASLHMATYWDCLGGMPMILREQNVEHRWLERYAGGIRNPLARAFARQQAARLRSVEASLCSRMSRVLAIHDEEARAIRTISPESGVEVIPVGVDPLRFLPRSPAPEPTVLVVGAYGWAPNRDGLRRFLAEGWPALRKGVPAAVLRVVGKDLPQDLRSRPGDGVTIVGYVDSVATEFASASVLVVPLWVAAGARVKIVEALMAGMPVVSTSLGAEGLGLTPGQHLMIADTPEGLATASADLLGDPARAGAMAAAGRAFALEHFSREAVAKRTQDVCARVLAESAHARAAR